MDMVKPRVGFIGLGVMGQSMAGHIVDAGYEVYLFNRSRDKAEALVAKGAVWEDTVAALAAKVDVVMTIVGYPADVESVYLGPEGLLENLAEGSLAIDMTTSDPTLAKRLYQEGKSRNIRVMDAPVSGGDLGAKNGCLSIMVGAEAMDFQLALPLFETMGKNIVLQGPPGAGQHTKMANQIAIAAGMVAMCESLAYAKKSGLDLETVLASIGQGAAGSWSLNNLGPRIIKGDFEPGFFVKHFIKDMGIALESAQSMGLDVPGLALALELYEKLAGQGDQDRGTQALYKLFD